MKQDFIHRILTPPPGLRVGGDIIVQLLRRSRLVRRRVVARTMPLAESPYGGVPGDQVGLNLRNQGDLLGLWDPQNRDLRRKLPLETIFSVG